MAKPTLRQTVEVDRIGLRSRWEEIGYCSECGAKVGRNQYGCDDDCPECGVMLDWGEE